MMGRGDSTAQTLRERRESGEGKGMSEYILSEIAEVIDLID